MNETIDRYIVDLIKTCNNLGFKTQYSCSAMECDHSISINMNPAERNLGYIAFRVSKNKAKQIECIAKNLGYRVDYTFCIIPFMYHLAIYQPYLGLGLDQVKGKLWDDLLENLKRLSNYE